MTEKDQRWVFHGDALPQSGGPGHPHTQITYVVKGVFSFTIDGETRTVRAGDTMLKTDSVVHGCVC